MLAVPVLASVLPSFYNCVTMGEAFNPREHVLWCLACWFGGFMRPLGPPTLAVAFAKVPTLFVIPRSFLPLPRSRSLGIIRCPQRRNPCKDCARDQEAQGDARPQRLEAMPKSSMRLSFPPTTNTARGSPRSLPRRPKGCPLLCIRSPGLRFTIPVLLDPLLLVLGRRGRRWCSCVGAASVVERCVQRSRCCRGRDCGSGGVYALWEQRLSAYDLPSVGKRGARKSAYLGGLVRDRRVRK